MAKLATIPVTVVVHISFYNRSYSTGTKLSLGVLLAGVGMATITDFQLNAFGTVIAGLAVVAAAVSQIWTQELQKNHGLSSTQLLHNASPLMAVLLFACGIPLDRALTGSTFLDYRYDQRLITSLVLSNLTAIAVNLATFLVIGKCSPVTFQARVKETHVAHCDLHPSSN